MSAVGDINALIPDLKAGRADAYRELVREMGEPLLRYAISIVGDPATAEDITQDALLRVYSMRARLDAQAELRGLCFRMVRNLARNQVRDRALRNVREQEARSMRPEQPEADNLAREAWSLVATLGAELREVVELRFQHGLSRSEIAQALELPEGTVATRQRTALESLRERMELSAPAASLPQLLADGAAHHPSAVQPLNIVGLEESLMASIRTIRNKTAGMAAAAVLGLLLVCALGAGTALALRDSEPPPASQQTVAHVTPGRNTVTPAASGSLSPAPRSNDARAAGFEANGAISEAANAPAPAEAAPETPAAEQPAPIAPTPEAAPEQPAPAPLAPAAAPPEFLSEPDTLAIADQPWEYLVRLGGTPAPALAAKDLPRWLKLEGSKLHGTPGRADMGPCAFALIASNGTRPDALQHVQLVVNAAPVFKSTPESKATAGTAYTCDIKVEAQPAAALTLSNAPKWLSVSGNTLSGTPTLDDAGVSAKITLTASNGVNPDATLDFTIEVSAAPVFTSTAVTTAKAGVAYSYKVTAKGHPAPTIDATGLPKWLKFANGELSGTPRNADIGKTRKITLRAKNGIKPDAEQAFVITVEANPDYVEMPWTVQDLRDYMKVGLKWSGTDYYQVSMASGQATYDKETYEIIAADQDGVTVKFTLRTLASTATEKAEFEDIVMEAKWAFKDLAEGRIAPHYGGKVTGKGTKDVKLGKKTYKCHVYEVEYDPKTGASGPDYRWTILRLYYIDGKPGVVALQEHVDVKGGVTQKGFELEEISK